MVWGMATSLAAFQVHLSVQLLTCLSDRCAASLQSGVRSWMTPSTWMMTLALWGTFVSHAEWLSLTMQRDKKVWLYLLIDLTSCKRGYGGYGTKASTLMWMSFKEGYVHERASCRFQREMVHKWGGRVQDMFGPKGPRVHESWVYAEAVRCTGPVHNLKLELDGAGWSWMELALVTSSLWPWWCWWWSWRVARPPVLE